MFNHRMPMMFRDYILVKKSTVFLAAAVATGLVARHFMKYHRRELDKMGKEVSDAIDTGKERVAEVADDIKDAKKK